MARPTDSRAEKCVVSIDVPMGETLFDAVVTCASLRHMSKAEYVRMVLETHFFGEMGRVRRMFANPEPSVHPNNVGG